MAARVKFRTKPEKIVETMLYLAHKGIELSQYKTVKLLYLADREHFRRFGRPISYDKYVAMEYGPVASIALDIINGKNVLGVDKDALPFEINTIGVHSLISDPKRDIRRELFSKSDLIILDDTVEKYGHFEFGKLYELTHKHFAYSRAWNNQKTKADPMFFEDFLDETANKEDKIQDLEFTALGM
ncbi:MAG: SocA family protein [Rhodobacteraceae bacterium]|nr:SocA family protein [Paracoccaceae bacterium]